MRAARTALKAVAGMVGDEESEVLCACFEFIEVGRAVGRTRVEVACVVMGE